MGRFTQGLYGYAFVLLVCLAGVGVFLLITPGGRTERVPRVEYASDQVEAARAASYEVLAPSRIPPGWVPTSSSLTREGGAVTWRLGFATAERAHAMVAQSDERPVEGYVSRMANTDKPGGSRQIDGVTWQERFRPDKDQRSLIRVFPDHAVIVTGSAGWDELTALVRTLAPQPEPGPAG